MTVYIGVWVGGGSSVVDRWFLGGQIRWPNDITYFSHTPPPLAPHFPCTQGPRAPPFHLFFKFMKRVRSERPENAENYIRLENKIFMLRGEIINKNEYTDGKAYNIEKERDARPIKFILVANFEK